MEVRYSSLVAFWISLTGIALANWCSDSSKKIEDRIEDFLLEKLVQHKMLVIPECLSHDSYDAIQLPIRLIKRWLENDHKISELVVGLETEVDNRKFELIRNNKYGDYDRFATICPGAWALFSTREPNVYLFFKDVMEKAPGRFNIFGFENSYHYFDPMRGAYLLPSQIDTIEKVEKIPNPVSKSPMMTKYAYSRFFRDYMSFSTIKEAVEANPDAHFLIIVGNAHTLKEMHFDDTDRQIIDAYHIDTLRYCHWLGYFLKQYHSPVFVQSTIDTSVSANTLTKYDPNNSDSPRYKNFFTDYYYSIPEGEGANVEESPLLCIPSTTNFSLLQNKRFQLYPSQEYHAIAKKVIYFMTGIVPEIKEEAPGQAEACTFIDPSNKAPIDFQKFNDSIIRWYFDGTFIKRIREDVAGYNHRSLFKGLFRMMGKRDFRNLTDSEAEEFSNYLLAALSIIGTEEEQSAAKQHLSGILGESRDHYFYYKKYYHRKYQL